MKFADGYLTYCCRVYGFGSGLLYSTRYFPKEPTREEKYYLITHEESDELLEVVTSEIYSKNPLCMEDDTNDCCSLPFD